MTTKHYFIHNQHESPETVPVEHLITEIEHDSKPEASHTLIQKTNFLIPKCTACKDEMHFSEGDIIYGDKWYHSSCWKDTEKIELASH